MVFMPKALHDAAGNIGRFRVHFHGSSAWRYDKIQILHGNSAEKYFFSKYQRSDEARSVSERHFYGPDIVANVAATVGGRNLTLLNCLKPKL
jgi:hypothetical protein